MKRMCMDISQKRDIEWIKHDPLELKKIKDIPSN